MAGANTPTTNRSPADLRRRNDLARIHMLKAEIRMTHDEYRDLLIQKFSTDTSSDLDAQCRAKLIHHLELIKQQSAPASVQAKPTRKRVELTPMQKKLWALWKTAVTAGKFRIGTWAALSAWCKRQTGGESGVDRVEWLNDQQISRCIDTLKALMKQEDTHVAQG